MIKTGLDKCSDMLIKFQINVKKDIKIKDIKIFCNRLDKLRKVTTRGQYLFSNLLGTSNKDFCFI